MISLLTKNRFNYAFVLFFIGSFHTLSAQCSITTQPSNATTCSGGNASFSLVATGSIIGYQWQVNTGSGFTNIINNAVYSNATTATLNITGANSTYNGYTYQCLVYNSCGGDIPSDIKTLTITPNTWTGVTSSDWHDGSNWSCGVVPTNQDDVDIIIDIFFTANEPTINSGMQAYCRNMYFDDLFGGLTYYGATLNIAGDLTLNSGSFFTNSTSFTVFNGTTAQHLNYGWLVVSNLTLNNSQNLIVNAANITANNTLNLAAGKLILSNNILQVNTISSANDTRYICTCDETGTPSVGGGVRKTIVTGNSFTFPISPNLMSYNPITISNTAGPNERFMVSINSTALTGANASEAVERTWHIEEENAGGNTATITLQWDESHEGSSFDRNSSICRILKSDGMDIIYSGYTIQAGAATNMSGTTWTKSLTGVTSFSPWGVTSQSCQPTITTQPNDVSTCSGGNASFTIAATGAITGYQWQVNTGSGFNNISNNAVYSNATTATLNITGANSEYTGYLYKCIVYDACGGGIASNNKTLTVTANIWQGDVSTDWFDPSNWSCGVVPTNHDDASVFNGSPNNPVISSGSQAYCRNLTKGGLFSGLNFSGATLNIYGNLTYNSGVFLSNSTSLMLFTGSSTQSLLGTATLTVSNLTINNSNNLVSKKNISVSNNLKLNAGKLILGDNILTVNNIQAASDTRYIALCDEFGTPSVGGSGVRKTIATGSNYTFPISPNLNSYNPITIANTSGPNEEFMVSVNDSPLPGANALESVSRTWHIEETTPGGNMADMTLQWDESQEGSNFLRTNCGIFKSDGANIDYNGYTKQPGAATNLSGTIWTKSLTGVTSFSPWGVTSDATVLPITLFKFEVQKISKNSAQINWHITEFSTPKGFEILKSIDAKHYESISYVPVHADLTYQFIDETLTNNTQYYQLKMIDLNGKIEYSRVVALTNLSKNKPSLALLPNIVRDETTLKIQGTNLCRVQINFVNTHGQVVKTLDFITDDRDSYSLDCSDLKAGLYLIQLYTEGGVSECIRLLKQ